MCVPPQVTTAFESNENPYVTLPPSFLFKSKQLYTGEQRGRSI